MAEERARHLEQLRRAYESGALDEGTYQAAVAALGGTVEVQATVEGSGAVAQEGSAAAGAGGVAVAGDVHGSVYVGPPTQDPAEALRIYRRVLVSTCCHLPLRGVDLGASDPTGAQQRLGLAQVYVDLDTKTPTPLSEQEKKERQRRPSLEARLRDEAHETRPLRALEAAAGNRRLVLLGDPGSGKSTFLGHLALCLAAHGLDPKAGWLEHLPDWPQADAKGMPTRAVPLLVTLRDFARWLPEKKGRAEPRHLWTFITSRLAAQNLSFAAEALARVLEAGEAIVLLDGLDEIPTRKQRAFVRDAVARFAGRYAKSRFLVTCRTLSYQDPAGRLEDFPAFELAPFDEAKIDRFIEAWYAELSRLGTVPAGDAEGLAARLREAVRRPDLWRLAPNPLLLTVMALVHTHKGRLPDARALLYEDTVDILLWRWEQIKAGGDESAPRLRQLLLDAGRTDVDLKRALWKLAYEAHGQVGAGDGEALADISEHQLQKALAELHPDRSLDWAQRAIAAIKLRAGLLLERAPEVYTFPHRTFQEYLAGAYLAAQTDFGQRAAELVEEGAFWREVILLAVGRLVHLGDVGKPLTLVGELCPAEAADKEAAWRKAWLAGEALLEAGLNRVQDSALGRDLARRVRYRLADLLRRGKLRPVERANAGTVLARLGDPRFRTDAWGLPGERLLGFIEIPAGPFRMGTREEEIDGLVERLGGEHESYERETPQHEVDLPAYYIARYPVTTAQFRAFVQQSGYKAEAPWERYSGTENQPVVVVTWYDAMAYCEWLTERLRTWEGTPEPLAFLLREPSGRVRLPSEAEWEKAARGRAVSSSPPSRHRNGDGGDRHSDGAGGANVYPWGNDPDPNRANYDDTGIGATSAVGAFPSGASPYGVLDLSGNVWEWTRSLWGEDYRKPSYTYPYDPKDGREKESAGEDVLRVIRGGAYYSSADAVRVGRRSRYNPRLRDLPMGFRVVVSPG